MDGGQSDVQYQVGEVLLGKYRIDRVLGQGGMGVVLSATHLELQQRVAIKVLLPNWPGSTQIETRFLREAQAAASIKSEHVVRVFDVGRLDSGTPYMVMELLEGHDLSQGALGHALPVEEAVDYLVQACDAMTAAHAEGLVHRDLKPANLFLSGDEHGIPTVKVLDFGISKLRRPTDENMALTEANGVMGSPMYMSPEQVRSARDVDARADLWSLGTILYELLSGEPPFNGETLGAVLMAVASESPRSLQSRRADVPAGLDAVVMRCLAKLPDERYQNAAELQRALLPYASARTQAKLALRHSGPPPASQLASKLPPRQGTLTTGAGVSASIQDAAKRSKVRVVALSVIGAAMALGAVVVGIRSAGRVESPGSSEVSEPSVAAAPALAAPVPSAEPAAREPSLSPTSAPASPDVPSASPRPEVSVVPRAAPTKTLKAAPTKASASVPVASAAPAAPVTPVSKKHPPTSNRNPLDINFK